MATLGASCAVENALNDLLSVLAHIGTQHPLLRTSKDVPAPPCPESTHLTLGSPLGTPGGTAATYSSTAPCSRSFASLLTHRLAPVAGPSSSPATRWSPPPQGLRRSLDNAIIAPTTCAPAPQSRAVSADYCHAQTVDGTTDSRHCAADTGPSTRPSRSPSPVSADSRPCESLARVRYFQTDTALGSTPPVHLIAADAQSAATQKTP